MRSKIYLIATFFILIGTCLANEGQANFKFLPIEIICIEPVSIENISIWVPAVKSGLFINRSCQPKENCSYSSTLPASINHTKTKYCPAEVARLLAEYTAIYHKNSLPLTIFNGWRWEYKYSLCQFESVTYDLPRRGGCWESCWEAVMNLSYGSSKLIWLEAKSLDQFDSKQLDVTPESTIEVRTFSSMRTRDGYPKERQL